VGEGQSLSLYRCWHPLPRATWHRGREPGVVGVVQSFKIHAGCLDEKTSAALESTSGARHNAPVFEAIVAQWPAMLQLTCAVTDTGDGRDQIRQYRQRRERWPAIPSKGHRTTPLIYDREPYQ